MNIIKIKIILIFIFFFSGNIYCQKSKNKNTKITFEIHGDLNNDNIKDLVMVKEYTNNEFHPCSLEIKFGNEKGEYKSVLITEKAVMEKSHDTRDSAVLENLEIKKGMLIFSNALIRGNLTHKFRYQNGNFELIGYTYNGAVPGYIESVDYNLSTGKKIMINKSWDSDKIIEKNESIEKLYPLPKLQDFTPFDFMY
ncbi:hypothetical protein [Flavobacterium algicola]|uniref:hypothetical protein n=1 Tax=Flavobacterium algicola TaxID=556529 RepID=UPI001EFEEA2E|nr:hypothetical protein [Flavobacterium algicola]MCG9793259.1 hypothetical protein [Flavobacterium algicola]